jgi:hypothetical protein
MPERIQLSRAKGWRIPANTVKVDRTTIWGNPWVPGEPGSVRMRSGRGWSALALPMTITVEGCIDRFRRWVRGEFTATNGAIRMDHPIYEAVICDEPPDASLLSGKNLACWCKLCPAHTAGKPFDVICEDCAPCHVDVLGPLANPQEGLGPNPTPRSRSGG